MARRRMPGEKRLGNNNECGSDFGSRKQRMLGTTVGWDGAAAGTTNVFECLCGRVVDAAEYQKQYPRRNGKFCSKSCASRYSNAQRKVHGSRATPARPRGSLGATQKPTGDMLAGL